MKIKFYFLLFLFVVPFVSKAQYTWNVIGDPTKIYVYVGTINMAPNDGSNFQKIKVDVFGGGWEADAIGETTYYIGNRGNLRASQVTSGSSNGNSYTLKAYQNGSSTDFYIVTDGLRWKAMVVRSFLFAPSMATSQMVNITSTTTQPANEIPLSITPVMITDQNGNIGLNTNNPDAGYKLSVNGSVRAKAVKVETGWADDVFNEDYILKPLSDVKKYIVKNKHLPDIPSEKEIASDGLNLGEMNKLLMKKVEELTLYLIRERENNNGLRKELSSYHRRLKKVEKELSNRTDR